MKTTGLDYEKKIVNCYNEKNFNKHTVEVCNAASFLLEQFPNGKAIHRSEIKLKGLGGEIKADLWIVLKTEQWIGISVKKSGAVRLSTAEGIRTAKIFKKVASSLSPARQSLLEEVADMVGDLPNNMVSAHNIEKARIRKPKKFATALDYDAWFEHDREPINERLKEVLSDMEIRKAIVEEMLTGRQDFAGTVGVAEYILTPKYFQHIDEKYVQSVAERVKIDVRGKSRGGISSACVMLDINI